MKIRILALDGISKEGLDVLNRDFSVDEKPRISEEELLKIIPEYDAVLVRSATKINRKVLDTGKKLRLVGRAGSGVDNVDAEAATEKGVLVMNVPGGNTLSACEHAFALMLSCLRNIPAASLSMKEG